MPLGILDVNEDHIPGTVVLLDQDNESSDHLKYTTVKGTRIILVPQPSNDPNESLNWPEWKKSIVFFVIFVNNIIFGAVPAPLFAASLTQVAESLNVSLAKVTALSGYMLLVASVLGPIVSALAYKFGKRPQFVFASVAGVIGTALCVASGQRYNAFLVGRILQAFGMTAFESLSLAVLGDLFYVHERGIRAGMIVLTLLCMPGVVSVVSGPITNNYGWRYMFIIYLPFTIVASFATFFLVPETQYISGLPEQPNAHELSVFNSKFVTEEYIEFVPPAASSREPQPDMLYAKKSYLQSLALTSGRYPGSLIKLLMAPLIILLNPAVVWSLLTSAVPVSLFGSMSFILAQIWSAAPYNLSAAYNGFFYVGAIIGGLVTGLVGGKICDMISDSLTERNRGTFEPEFRIPVQIIGSLFCGLGFFIFMWDMNHPTPHGYYLGSVCHGFTAAGVTLTATSSSLYMIDAFRSQATEVFILNMSTKNLLFYGISSFINDWATQDGGGEVFKVWGIICLCVLTLNIPMYVFGKVNRKFVMRLKFIHNFTGY